MPACLTIGCVNVVISVGVSGYRAISRALGAITANLRGVAMFAARPIQPSLLAAVQPLRRRGEDAIECARRVLAEEALLAAFGSQADAARMLGISRRRMHYYVRGGRSQTGEMAPAIVCAERLGVPPKQDHSARWKGRL